VGWVVEICAIPPMRQKRSHGWGAKLLFCARIHLWSLVYSAIDRDGPLQERPIKGPFDPRLERCCPRDIAGKLPHIVL